MLFLLFGVYFIFVGIASLIADRAQRAAKLIQENDTMELMGGQISYCKRMMVWNVVGIIVMLLVGGCIAMALEDWTFIQGLYFALQTATVSLFHLLCINFQSLTV